MSNRDRGVLAVNRQALLRQAMSRGGIQSRTPSVNLTHEDIFRRYRGFDGESWPERDHPEFDTENGLASLSSMSAVQQYIDRLDPHGECDLILVDSTVSADYEPSDVGQKFLGFDVGIFESESSHFSSILNEVIYGHEPEMRAFAALLNEALLFSTVDDARDLHALRERLLKRGADLEDCGVFHTYAVYTP